MSDRMTAWGKPRSHWLAGLILLAAAIDFLDMARAAWPFVTDDMYISLRYARNWVDGNGLAWNPADGVTVEGYSNFTFVALAAAALKLGLDPVPVLRLVGTGAVLLACPLLYRQARPVAGPILATIPTVLLLAFPGTAWWAVSGLETGFFVLVVVASVSAFVRGLARGETITMVGAGALVAVAGMTRPEGPLVGLAMAQALVVDAFVPGRGESGRWRGHARLGLVLALGFLAAYLPFFAWRVHTFGRLLPNTVWCKAAYTGDPWRLITESAPILVVCIAVAIPALRRWHRPGLAVPLLTTVLYCVALHGASPTVGYLGRHFLAAFALLTVPATAGASTILARLSPRPAAAAVVVALGLKTTLAGALVAGDVQERVRHHAESYGRREAARRDLAHWLARHLPAGSAYVMGDVGVVGHEAPRLGILDAYCLNTPEMTDGPMPGARARFAALVAERAPAAIVVASKRRQVLTPRSGIYRHIMAHPRFAEIYGHAATFGAAGDTFQYWVYLRRDLPTAG